jgi:hypothetical protein
MTLPLRVNAFSVLVTPEGLVVTIGSSDSATKQYIFSDPQLKMLIEEAVRVYSAEQFNECPISA